MSHILPGDREAYPEEPPESPWRSRLPHHRDHTKSPLKRITTFASILLLCVPLLLLFRHLHGSADSDIAATEDYLASRPATHHRIPAVPTSVPVSATVEIEYGPEDVDADDEESAILVEPLPVVPPHPMTFSLIMFSSDSASEGALLIKSIIMYTSAPVHFHIICDEGAREYLEGRLALVTRPRHNIFVRFYLLSHEEMMARIEREGAITTDHSAGVPGLMKLFIHEILPDTVKRAIFLDTDAFFISDPILLWNRFDDFTEEAAVSMPTHFDQSSTEWHDANRICSCVMLLDLEKLRKLRLMDSILYHENDPHGTPALSPPAFRDMFGPPGGSGHYEGVKLGDQGYWWAIVKHNPKVLQHLHFDYEVSSCLLNMYGAVLGDDGANEEEAKKNQVHVVETVHEGDLILPKVLHFNCLDGTPRFFEWEGWSDPTHWLTRSWGPAVFYHVGVKWLWLNQGLKDVSSVVVESARHIVFADERYGHDMESDG
ncbi:hypothetical protein EUX98_g2821 [Antrodiella citrinella]|uniref:Glycosyltransferase family 8 protein n=1 Tax=Antrodiella citrinella TaxID=2447956 RepID=A0A4S4MY24_9APHY|nr:hypothetical protein EUX98_g2821 [Antrodiella citrinella]